MAKVWVQAWTAQVAGSVAVEESVLRQVAGLESVRALVPMLAKVQESEWESGQWELVNLTAAEELVEVLPPLRLVKESE